MTETPGPSARLNRRLRKRWGRYDVVKRGGKRPWHVESLFHGHYGAYKTEEAARKACDLINGIIGYGTEEQNVNP